MALRRHHGSGLRKDEMRLGMLGTGHVAASNIRVIR
jgi:hypothetical protein